MSMNQRLARVSEIIADHGAQPSQLIAILQDTQTAFNYLSQEDMTLIAQRLGISTAKVYSVATFTKIFLWSPRASTSSACATAPPAMSASPSLFIRHPRLYQAHPASARPTPTAFSPWRRWRPGCLRLSPVLTIDGEVHAKMTPDSALALLESIRKEEELAK